MKDEQGRNMARLGDTTDHGGKVIQAAPDFSHMGIHVALDGHAVECPKCGGVFPIVASGSFTHKGSLDENAQHTVLTLRFNDMFLPGETTVNAWVGPLIARIGQEIAGMPGKVQVTGYTDSLPPDRHQLVSNQTLSEERATQVMQILVAAGVPSDRLMSTGKGDANPVAGNETPEGRTKNRRVEVTVSE
jgi:flagellar motor protein MotB